MISDEGPGPRLGGGGWERLAQSVSEVVSPGEVDGVWVFAPVRRDDREWGTAIFSQIDGQRRRIYTARYVLAVRGKQRGKFESTIREVGSGPVEAVARLVQDAQRRMDDEHPPSAVLPEAWFSSVVARADGTPG